MPTQMITCFILITLWLGSSVLYAEAACEHCTKILDYRGPLPNADHGHSWFISEGDFLNDIKDIVSDTSAIPAFDELTTLIPKSFSIKADLCGDNITFNMALENIEIYFWKVHPRGYRIISWHEPTQKFTISDSGALVAP